MASPGSSSALGLASLMRLDGPHATVERWSVGAALPFLVALYTLPKNPDPWKYYGIATGLLATPYVHPIQVAWASRNSGNVRARTVWVDLQYDRPSGRDHLLQNIQRRRQTPRYRRGNRVLITICCVNLLLYVAIKVYYVRVNAYRDRKWNAMSSEEKTHYLATTKDDGNKRLDFRFAH